MPAIPANILGLLEQVNQLTRERYKIYVVGGLIRDLYYAQENAWNDLDLVSEHPAAELGQFLADKLNCDLKVFPTFLTAKLCKLKLSGVEEIDLVTTRQESYLAPGALPSVELADIKQDLFRRDFSLNSIAVALDPFYNWCRAQSDFEQLRPFLLDPTNGLVDLKSRQLRVLHSASFIDDPTRIYRGLRYLARIDGQFEENTEILLREALASGALLTVSPARKVNELKKIIAENSVETTLRHLIAFDLLSSEGLIDPMKSADFWNQLTGLAKISNLDIRWQVFLLLVNFNRSIPFDQFQKYFSLSNRKALRLNELVTRFNIQLTSPTGLEEYSNLLVEAFSDSEQKFS